MMGSSGVAAAVAIAIALAVPARPTQAAAGDDTARADAPEDRDDESSDGPTADDEALVIVPMPALVVVLQNLENAKGAPLTRDEVLEARDEAHCVVLPRSAVRKLESSRGYVDIDPERAWEEWQAYKAGSEDGAEP